MGNEALATNARVAKAYADIQITTHGSNWYWAVCALMAVSTLAFAGMAFRRPRPDRIMYYIMAAVTLIAAIDYFTLASNLGQVPIAVQFYHGGRFGSIAGPATREIFYVRYIDWAITTPLILLALLLTAGVPWPTILITLLMAEVMVVTGLVGALTSSSYKWGYWTFGVVALLYIAYALGLLGRQYAKALGPKHGKVYNTCAFLTLFLWFLYPIAWGLSEGGNVIHPDSEGIFYGILDIFSKVVFGALLLNGHKTITSHEMGLHIREPSELPYHHREKVHTEPGVVNGTTTV